MKPHTLIHCSYEDYSAALRSDARTGLASGPKWLPSRWCFDGRGRVLFGKLAEHPDYRFAAVEQELLTSVAAKLTGMIRPATFIHIGPTSPARARPLIRALRTSGALETVNVCDTPHSNPGETLPPLAAEFARMDWYAVTTELPGSVPALSGAESRLFGCLGESFASLRSGERLRLLSGIRKRCTAGDQLLITTMLPGGRPERVNLLSGGSGVVSEFNKNVLYVINHMLDADCTDFAFDHVVGYDEQRHRVELRLRARTRMRVEMLTLGFHIDLAAGEEIRTFGLSGLEREQVDRELAEAGFSAGNWWREPTDLLAIALAEAV